MDKILKGDKVQDLNTLEVGRCISAMGNEYTVAFGAYCHIILGQQFSSPGVTRSYKKSNNVLIRVFNPAKRHLHKLRTDFKEPVQLCLKMPNE